jgi:hypothetical protein
MCFHCAKAPPGLSPAGLSLQLGLHAYRVGRQPAEPAPPVHNWVGAHAGGIARGGTVKTTLAGASFAKLVH